VAVEQVAVVRGVDDVSVLELVGIGERPDEIANQVVDGLQGALPLAPVLLRLGNLLGTEPRLAAYPGGPI
jgi:hypothetical protein